MVLPVPPVSEVTADAAARIVATRQVLARWNVPFDIPDNVSLDEAGKLITQGLQRAAEEARKFELDIPCVPDFPGLVGGFPGFSLDALLSDMSNPNPGSSGDEWGIAARVSSASLSFDIPIVYGIDEDAARRILKLLEGREDEFVDVDLMASTFPDSTFQIVFHADSWRTLKAIAAEGDVPLPLAAMFRRPVMWDMLRAEMAGIPASNMPAFDVNDFNVRYMKSIRYDYCHLTNVQQMLTMLSKNDLVPFTMEWQNWFAEMLDMLYLVGKPSPLPGLSVVIHLVAEESADGSSWEPFAPRTVLVACGLDPVGAYQLLEVVRSDPEPFLDLPDTDRKKFRVLGAAVIADAMLWSRRVTLSGRSNAYDFVAMMTRAA